jgi:hypothetical protein
VEGREGAAVFSDGSAFRPTMAIFAAGRAAWAIIPPGFKMFERAPE